MRLGSMHGATHAQHSRGAQGCMYNAEPYRLRVIAAARAAAHRSISTQLRQTRSRHTATPVDEKGFPQDLRLHVAEAER